jgi:hypothetical protein
LQSSGGVEAVGNTDDNNIIISTISTTVAQSGQALWPFESQIPGSNPGRSKILFYFYLTAIHIQAILAQLLTTIWLVGW